MKTFKIWGESDDLIETEGVEGADEFYAKGSGPHVGRYLLKAHDGEIEIHCIYAGFWAFAIGPGPSMPGDSDQMPDWPIRRSWGGGRGYSELVEIDVPDDAVVVDADAVEARRKALNKLSDEEKRLLGLEK